MFQHSHSNQNQKAVIGSAILAKAVTKLPNGRYEMIVVFAESTRQEFYWIFQIRSPRSPLRSWKFVGYATRDLSPYYQDFGSFVAHRANLRSAQILSVRMPQKRRLAVLRSKVQHESIFSDWAPRDAQPMATMMHKRGTGHKGRRSSWAS